LLFDACWTVVVEHQPQPFVDVPGLQPKLGGDDDGVGHDLLVAQHFSDQERQLQ